MQWKVGSDLPSETENIDWVFRELMAEALIQCGHFILLPKQLARLNYDPGKEKEALRGNS